jgi:hypothetical protein
MGSFIQDLSVGIHNQSRRGGGIRSADARREDGNVEQATIDGSSSPIGAIGLSQDTVEISPLLTARDTTLCLCSHVERA